MASCLTFWSRRGGHSALGGGQFRKWHLDLNMALNCSTDSCLHEKIRFLSFQFGLIAKTANL